MAKKDPNSRQVAAKRAAASSRQTDWTRPLLLTAGLAAGAWLLRRTLPGRVVLGALKFAPLLLPLLAAKVADDAQRSELEVEPETDSDSDLGSEAARPAKKRAPRRPRASVKKSDPPDRG
jgi:hypothetical protein